MPGWSGTQRLARLLPERGRQARWRSSAERYRRGAGAARSGFVAEVAGRTPLAAARAIAERAATLSPRAAEIAKYMIQAGGDEDRAALIEALGSGLIAATDDRAEGRRRLPREARSQTSRGDE